MPLPRRKSSNTRGLLLKGVGVLAAVVGLAIIGGAAWYNLTHGPIAIDPATLCPKAGPLAKTIVVIDASDPLTPVAQEDIKNQVTDLARAVPKFGLLELRQLSPTNAGGLVLFSRCNPGDGVGLSELVSNPERERRRWEKEFDMPLQNVLSRTVAGELSDTSPIMETIQWIGVRQFSPSKLADGQLKLVLVSDMIQHSEAFSQYRENLQFDEFRKLPSYEPLRTDLHGAGVTVFYVHRQGSKVNEGDHVRFWEDWITDSKGSLDRIKKVLGAQ